MTLFNASEITSWNKPFSLALTNLAASTVIKISAGVFFPSISVDKTVSEVSWTKISPKCLAYPSTDLFPTHPV